MKLRWIATLAATAVFVGWSVPARAELVYFSSGRALSVKAIRSHGDLLVLKLRAGGEITCDRDLIANVAPDEVEYPEEVLEPAPSKVKGQPAVIPAQFRPLVTAAAAKHGVDERLIHAVIQVESGYQSRARSTKGARGLMQVLPSTGRQYGALDLFDPTVNLDAGVRHLKSLLSRFDLPMALAAYNAGEGAVTRFKGIPPFRETQNYVTRIMRIVNGS
jgi:soluble lytic murein transglycosylase-like protein